MLVEDATFKNSVVTAVASIANVTGDMVTVHLRLSARRLQGTNSAHRRLASGDVEAVYNIRVPASTSEMPAVRSVDEIVAGLKSADTATFMAAIKTALEDQGAWSDFPVAFAVDSVGSPSVEFVRPPYKVPEQGATKTGKGSLMILIIVLVAVLVGTIIAAVLYKMWGIGTYTPPVAEAPVANKVAPEPVEAAPEQPAEPDAPAEKEAAEEIPAAEEKEEEKQAASAAVRSKKGRELVSL